VTSPDIDALADTMLEGFTFVLQADDGPVIKVGEAADRGSEAALSDLVAIAKEDADGASDLDARKARIDALARRVRGSLSSFQAHRVEAALTLLVATAKEAEEWRDIAPPELGTPGLFRMHVDCLEEAHGEAVEDAEAAEADNRAMQQEADEMEARVAAQEAALVETNLRVGTVLMALGFIKRGRTGFHAICERELTEADEIARAALASPDPKEGAA